MNNKNILRSAKPTGTSMTLTSSFFLTTVQEARLSEYEWPKTGEWCYLRRSKCFRLPVRVCWSSFAMKTRGFQYICAISYRMHNLAFTCLGKGAYMRRLYIGMPSTANWRKVGQAEDTVCMSFYDMMRTHVHLFHCWTEPWHIVARLPM